MKRKKALPGEPMRHGTDSLYKKLPFFLKSGGSVKALFETNRHFMDHLDHMDKMDFSAFNTDR